MGRLNLGQRCAFLIGLGLALAAFGRWVTALGSHLPSQWVAYAPLAHRVLSAGPLSTGGLHRWVRLLIWLGLILAWTATAIFVLRTQDRLPEAD